MAADLVNKPALSQNFIHDLESSFWVLFWVTLMYVKTCYTPQQRSTFLKSYMSPVTFSGSGGPVKSTFMESLTLLADFETPNNVMLGELVRGLHLELGERYRSPNKVTEPQQHVSKDMYDTITKRLSKALSEPHWTESDRAELQVVNLPDEEQSAASSGSKRSRSVAEQSGGLVQEPPAKRS